MKIKIKRRDTPLSKWGSWLTIIEDLTEHQGIRLVNHLNAENTKNGNDQVQMYYLSK